MEVGCPSLLPSGDPAVLHFQTIHGRLSSIFYWMQQLVQMLPPEETYIILPYATEASGRGGRCACVCMPVFMSACICVWGKSSSHHSSPSRPSKQNCGSLMQEGRRGRRGKRASHWRGNQLQVEVFLSPRKVQESCLPCGLRAH